MNKTIFIFFVLALSISCSKQTVNKKREILIFSYKILETEEFLFSNTEDVYYNVAKVQLNIPDTIITFYDIANCVKNICVNEDILVAKFYKNDDCWKMEMGVLPMDEGVYNECFIGYIDLRGRGLNWKHKIKIDDFHFNDTEGLPIKINVK